MTAIGRAEIVQILRLLVLRSWVETFSPDDAARVPDWIASVARHGANS